MQHDRFKKIDGYMVVLLFLFTCLIPVSADEKGDGENAPFFLDIAPELTLPLGNSANTFGTGGGLSINAGYRLPFFSLASVRLGFEYSYDTTVSTPTVSLASAVAGLGIDFALAPFLGIGAYTAAGYTFCFLNPPLDFEGYGNPYLKAGISLSWRINPGFALQVGGSFLYEVGLYTGIGVSVGTSIGLGLSRNAATPESPRPTTLEEASTSIPPEKAASTVKLEIIDLAPVFPVFYKYYDDHPMGSVRLTNDSEMDVTDLSVSFLINDYMSAAQQLKPEASLQKGQAVDIPLYALFSDKILSVTERTKAQAEIDVSYSAEGRQHTLNRVESITIVDRNAMSWDDDNKAAPFVTPKDTPVMSFAKNVAGVIKGKGSAALNARLSTAMAMHEALAAYGLAYVVDPKSSYADFSARKTDVDYLQFPRQTLAFKAGDCDDLAILNCALLESVGVETAFITIPGHIFMAFSLDMKPDEARAAFSRIDNLILRDEQSWVPVEITQINGGFLKAWELGAQEWREYHARGKAGFMPVHEAWKLYEPVFFKGEDVQVNVPPSDTFLAAFRQEQTRFIDQEIYREVARLQAEIQKSKSDPNAVNKLGVLYARYGLFDRAQAQFTQIIRKQEYVPALANLGHIAYVQGRLEEANGFYERAYKVKPDDPLVLLGLARVNHAQENYGAVKKYYDILSRIDPILAGRFAYLGLKGDESTREADISGERGVLIWSE